MIKQPFLRSYALIFASLLILALANIRCASTMPQEFTTKVMYQDNDFISTNYSDARLLILPLITQPDGIDSSGIFSPAVQAKRIHATRPDIKLVSYEEFSNAVGSHNQPEFIDTFFNLLRHDINLRLYGNKDIWDKLPADFCIVPVIRKGRATRNLENRVYRTLSMEIDIWDIQHQRAVYRLEVSGSQTSTLSDRVFVGNALNRFYDRLPVFKPTLRDAQW